MKIRAWQAKVVKTKYRLVVLLTLLLVSAAIAVHHELPMDMHDSAIVAMCLGIAISTGIAVAAVGGTETPSHRPIVIRPRQSARAIRYVTANTSRAGPKRAGLTVIRN